MFHGENTGATNVGTKDTYGLSAEAVGDTAGTSRTYGLYVSGAGADTNYGLYSSSGSGVFVLDAGEQVYINATSTPQTQTEGALEIDVTTATTGVKAVDIDINNTKTTGIGTTGMEINARSSVVVTSGNQSLYGAEIYSTKSGADTNADATNVRGVNVQAQNTGSTDVGTRTTMGGYFAGTGDTAGTSIAYGIYATATGADTNYAGYFDGNLYSNGTNNFYGTTYLQNTGVDHGMTDLALTDAYGKIAPINTSKGGLNIFALSDTDSSPLQIYGVFGTNNPTDTTGAIILGGSKKDGTTHQAIDAAETVLHLRNYSTDLLTILGSGETRLAYGKITAGSGTGITVNSLGHLNRQTYKVTTTYAAYADTDTKKGLVIATLPAKMKIVGFYSETTAAYTGGAVSATMLRVGVTAEDAAEIIADHDVKTAVVTKGLTDADMGTSMTRAAQIQGGYLPSWTGTTAIYATINTTDANTNVLTTGSTTFYIVTEQF